MHVVQLANFYGPTSGGQRTAIDRVGRGYLEAGHRRTLVVPGEHDADERTPGGRRISLAAPLVPGAGGYRAITDLRRVRALLDELAPDRLEVSDKLTLWRAAAWARRAGVPSVLWSHERLDAILAPRVPPGFPLRRAARRWNRHLVGAFDRLVCASAFAAEELHEAGGRPALVPLGVDLDVFTPTAADGPTPSAGPADARPIRLVSASRLSREKRPDLAVATARVLAGRGHRVQLTLAGAGPLADELRALAGPVELRLVGHVSDRQALAALLGGADVALAPSPCETFGLAALEALACGTPVVAADAGAAPEVVTSQAGRTAPLQPDAFADAVLGLLDRPVAARRAAARARAEQLPWTRTVAGMLAVHDLAAPVPA